MSSKVYNRVIGRLESGQPGPTVILIGSLHGNEPAGAEALTRVFAGLEADLSRLRGTTIGLAGNLAALEKKGAIRGY